MIRLFISPFDDPRLNLALEDSFLEHLTGKDQILFLYVNRPSVVMGRFQNPWLECRPAELGEILLVRRQSGGGTVFHDPGNLNFSLITHIEQYDRIRNLELICRIMEHCGVDLNINDRHDLTVRLDGMNYKVSGSAFRHKKDRAFHHGTLLISSDREILRRALTPPEDREFLHTAGTASHRSPVINLNRLNPDLTVSSALEEFRRWFRTHPGIEEAPLSESRWQERAAAEDVRTERERLCSSDWIFGKTPHFRQLLPVLPPGIKAPPVIDVKKGVITEAPEELSFLTGLPYGRPETAALLRERLTSQTGPGGSGFERPENEFFSRLVSLIG